jgi:membrane-associated phospholipid phosphatase
LQLFYLINGWAGRNDFADAALRLFYVSAVPLLATVLAALLILVPRQERTPSRWLVALAAVLAISLCVLTRVAVESFTRQYLNTEILSPRPFVTHYATLLVVEPNDNSFPCPEVMLAATLAVLIWATFPAAGTVAILTALFFCFTRVFCGSNYVADVGVGAALGACWATLSLALCRISIQVPLRDGHSLIWRVRPQAVLSGGAALFILLGTVFSFACTPRYGPILRDLWRGSTATAAPVNAAAGHAAPLETALMMGASLPRNA